MEGLDSYAKEKAKKVPGLGLVAAVLSALIAVILHKSSSDFDIWLVGVIWALAYGFYRLGSCLDKKVFDPLYSERKDFPTPPPSWHIVHFVHFLRRSLYLLAGSLPGAKELRKTREKAAKMLHEAAKTSNPHTSTGIYKTAEKLFGKSDDWDQKVKPLLNLSKAARTFVIPLALILLYDVLYVLNDWPAPNCWLAGSLVWSALSPWPAALLILIIFLLLYVWLRVRYMIALYKLIENATVFSFTVQDPQGQPHRIVCVANVVSPARELPIFGRG
jgi:hypothetical protein